MENVKVLHEGDAVLINGKVAAECLRYDETIGRLWVRLAGSGHELTVHPARVTQVNPRRYEATVGSYDDLTILGDFPTREQALQALGQWFLDNPTAQLMYPAINEIVQLQPWG